MCLAQTRLRGTLSADDVTGIVSDPEALALAARTSWRAWPDSGFPARFPAELTATTTSGRKLTVKVEDVWGSATRPIGSPALANAVAAEIVAAVDGLSSLSDVREFTALLGTGTPTRVDYSTSGGSSSDSLMCSDSAIAAARFAASCCFSSSALASAAV